MKKILLILLALIILVSMCSCGGENKTETEDETELTASDTEEATPSVDTEEDVSKEFYISDADVYEIETPYGPIYYPTKWKDIVVTEVTEGDSSYRIKFSAQLDEKSVALYSVIFGEASEKHIVSGTLSVDEATHVRVYFEDHSAEGMNAGLSENSEQTYLAMCEDMNVIISKLVYVSGMELD